MSQVFVPRESVNDQSVLVQAVRVASGTSVRSGEVVVEIETSKTMIELAAPEDGVVVHALTVGDEVEVGALLFSVGELGAAPAQPPAAPAAVAPVAALATPPASIALEPAPTEPRPGQPAVLSRAAAAAAQASGLDLAAFAGRWVTLADVQRGRPAESRQELAAVAPAPARDVAVAQGPVALPTLAYEARTNNMRKRAEIESLLKGRHADTVSTIGMVVRLPGRRIVAPDFLFRDSISDLVIFEGARLLRQYPELNAFHIDDKRHGQFTDVNFGVSFDNVQNLKVLTIPNADTSALAVVQQQFSALLDLFESGKPIPAELMGTSTVTLSDLSTTDASFMLPLINGQQSLILGVVRRAAREFELLASFDHRVSEGMRVTRFLEALRDRIESHYRDEAGIADISCHVCGKGMRDEVRLGNRGMISMTLPDGALASLCRNCFEGR